MTVPSVELVVNKYLGDGWRRVKNNLDCITSLPGHDNRGILGTPKYETGDSTMFSTSPVRSRSVDRLPSFTDCLLSLLEEGKERQVVAGISSATNSLCVCVFPLGTAVPPTNREIRCSSADRHRLDYFL